MAGGLFEEAPALIVTEGLNIHASLAGNFADAKRLLHRLTPTSIGEAWGRTGVQESSVSAEMR